MKEINYPIRESIADENLFLHEIKEFIHSLNCSICKIHNMWKTFNDLIYKLELTI